MFSQIIHFSTSGVETYWWLPILVAFFISSITSTAGITGAFLLLPFQVSYLGFAGPAASSTNLLFNVIAAPAGVVRYIRDERIVWVLAMLLITGLTPGFIAGAIVRIRYLPDPRLFKLFIALVLLYVCSRLLMDALKRNTTGPGAGSNANSNSGNNTGKDFTVSVKEFTIKRLTYVFQGADYHLPTTGFLLLSTIMGVVSGIYGIGGGALVAPILITMFKQPVHVVSGITLFSTFIMSILGIFIYTILNYALTDLQLPVSPDWQLGFLFGIGGLLGIYTGSVVQKYLPVRLIKFILIACMGIIIYRYLIQY